VRLLGDDGARLAERFKTAETKVTGASNRAKGAVASVQALAKDAGVAATVKRLTGTLDLARDANVKLLESWYTDKAAALGVKAVPAAPTDKEREYALLIPRRLFKVYSVEARARQAAGGGRGGGGRGGQRGAPGTPAPRRLPGMASAEVANFIDGTRSVLDIYNAVRAECGNLVIGNNDTKYAYLLSPDAPDVDLDLVYAALETLQKNGVIEITRVEPKPVAGKKTKK
jgi:hypothetical protein